MIDPNIPFVELHRHLDGAIRIETIIDLGRKHNIPLPSFDIEGLRPHVQVSTPKPGLMEFLEKFEWLIKVLADYDACRRIAYENILDAKNEGIDYIELRFSPLFMASAHKLSVPGVVEAIVEGVKEGVEETGVKANLIGIMSRTFGADICMDELNALLTQKDHIVALDLAGDEGNFPGALFEEHFNIGRDAGWEITVHAGEAAGPESVWQALDILKATRVGHATRINEDEKLIEAMLERGIGIEANLTSNVQTSTVPDLISHPAANWIKRGLKVSLNTDDPGISNIDLLYEFNVAAPKAGFSPALARQAQINAVELAFISSEEREALYKSKLN
jgi:adenosine deaminase